MSIPFMPFRGERNAPVFDPSDPSTLRQYFVHLERLFARCAITSDPDKKEYATSFLSWKTAEQWECLPEYTEASKSYENLKNRLLELYNQSDLRYTFSDLEELIVYHRRLELRSRHALTEFHLRFNEISRHLFDLGLLSLHEQSKMYLQAFDVSLRSRVELRLQILFPDCSPSHAYPVDLIFEAARWALQDPGVPSTTQVPVAWPVDFLLSKRVPGDKAVTAASTKQSKTSPASSADFVKTEHLKVAFHDLSKTIIDAVSGRQHVRTVNRRPAHPTSTPTVSRAVSAFMATSSTPVSIPTVSKLLYSHSRPLSNASSVHSPPKTPLEEQRRIQEIEEELHILRAHCNISTAPTPSIRSTTHPEVVSSTVPPLRKISTASTTPRSQYSISSTRDRLSSIVNPATFIHKGRLYQAIQWTPRHCISPTNIKEQVSTDISTDFASLSLPLPHIVHQPCRTTSTISISTSQPLETQIAMPTPLQSPTITLLLSVFALTTSPIACSYLSILSNSPRFLAHYLRRYIRNHARLKGIRCDLGFK